MSQAPASPVLEAALRWIKRGAAPIPVKFKEKVPVGAEWQKQRLSADDVRATFNGTSLNVGILWGAPSNNVVDIDLDWPEACALAAELLPATAVYGRTSSRSSHRLYQVPGAVTSKWTVPQDLVPTGRKAVLLELRADGTQSVVPPSTHPSGELYAWIRERKPQAIDSKELLRKLNLVAAGAVLIGHWRDGARHNLALALSGAALSTGYTVEEVSALVSAIAQAAGDPEPRDRVLAVQSSASALASGRPATGVPKLAELVGEPTVALLKRWLGLANPMPGTTTSTSSTAPSWSGPEPAALAVRAVSNVEEKPMHWLWPNRIARGKLHIIGGEPGLSKSVLTCAIAGIVTTGGEWPLDNTRAEVGDVLMLNVEDDPADTIRPRLRAAGAALDRVVLIDGVRTSDGKQRGMTLADVELLDNYLAQHPGRFVLLTCDPIGALMANKDTHRDSDVRSLLAPLAQLAMKHELAILLVAHLNKATGMAALHRIVGSIGFSAAARMVYFLARDPEDPTRLLLVPGKANLAPLGMAGLSYELESADLGNGIVAPRIRWHDVPEMRSANEVLAPTRPEQQEEQGAIDEWLRDRLANGPVLVRALQEEAKLKIPASWRTVERTAGRIGIVGTGEHRSRTWQLPDGEPSRHNDITTSRHEPAVVSESAPTGQSDKAPSTWRDVVMSECRDAPATQQTLLPAETAGLHPCTECAKLNVGGYCTRYQRVMPEPAVPNACVHFEPRQPDVPWQ